MSAIAHTVRSPVIGGLNLFAFLTSQEAQGAAVLSAYLDTSQRILALVLGYAEQEAAKQGRPSLAFDDDVWQDALNHVPLLRPLGSGTDTASCAPVEPAALKQLLTGALLGSAAPEAEQAADVAAFAARQADLVLSGLDAGAAYAMHVARVTIAGPSSPASTSLSASLASISLGFTRHAEARGGPARFDISTRTSLMRLDLALLHDPANAGQFGFIRNADPGPVVGSDGFIAIGITDGSDTPASPALSAH